MTDKELRRLKRVDLLELMLSLSRENERLKQELEAITSQLGCAPGDSAQAALQLGALLQAARQPVPVKPAGHKVSLTRKAEVQKPVSVKVRAAAKAPGKIEGTA